VIRVLSDQFNETNQKGLHLEDEPMGGWRGSPLEKMVSVGLSHLFVC